MINKIISSSMGYEKSSWLESKFHFSFGKYIDKERVRFGTLRVVNDDIISPENGFDTHPHENMEIISYIIDGELTHKDSMNNERTLSRGDFQYMSAGTGVTHSEYNKNSSIPTRILQMWILPDKQGYTPDYGDFSYDKNERKNKFFHGVSSKSLNAPIKINQDANIYVTEIDADNTLTFQVGQNRQCYLVQLEGNSMINDLTLKKQDALQSIEEDLVISTDKYSHVLIVEMAKS